ncbi:hypothetical protein BFN03_14030 [Rhodococcus sp. WMMA185]|nr:hypothetical protein BFN03_14030 [Rhodococcus sp. WMMA185]
MSGEGRCEHTSPLTWGWLDNGGSAVNEFLYDQAVAHAAWVDRQYDPGRHQLSSIATDIVEALV